MVIGQVDFTHNSANQGGSVGANTLYYPRGINVDDQRLFIADQSNYRVLIYYLKILSVTITTPQPLSSTSIRWNFTDNDTIETGFKLYDSLNNLISTNSTADLSYIDETNLTPNTQYTRYIKAYNAGGESISSQTASTYTLAPTPSNLTATANLSTISLTVDAFPNHTAGQAGYYFESSTGNNSGWIQTNTWQETNLNYDKEYTYTVKYRNGNAIETSTISTTQSTPFASFGTVVLQPQASEPTPTPQEVIPTPESQQQPEEPQPTQQQIQEQKQALITEIKAKLVELIIQLIVLLQQQVSSR